MSMPEPEGKLAQESEKTKKAREKLIKKFQVYDAKITPEALKKKTTEIHRWIARHAHHRVALKNKNISLFDENQNAAKLSTRVASLADKIREDFFVVPEPELEVAETLGAEESKI